MKIKKRWITLGIIFIIVIISIIVLATRGNGVSKELAKCIGENSEFYVQLGCSACEKQKEMFGKNSQYLNIIDCWFEREKCLEITHVPTWIINEEKYTGVQNIETLKELTGCN